MAPCYILASIKVKKMERKNEKINAKIKQLGQMLGMDEATSIKAKRKVKNIVATAIIAGILLTLASLFSSNGTAGAYYGGGGIRDFQLLFRGFF